jgi:hypothetical protein
MAKRGCRIVSFAALDACRASVWDDHWLRERGRDCSGVIAHDNDLAGGVAERVDPSRKRHGELGVDGDGETDDGIRAGS